MPSVVLQPCADASSRRNFGRTIEVPVPFDRLADLLGSERGLLLRAHPDGSAAMWGSVPHRDALRDHGRLRPGDVVLFAGQGRFFQKGTVTAAWRNPALARRLWGEKADGQTWELMYSLTDLEDLDVPYELLNALWNYDAHASPRSFRLLDDARSQAALDYLGQMYSAAPAHYVPAEAVEDTADLLRQLIGVPLQTVAGRSNVILGVQPPDVIVATERSPQGQPVPIAWVDEALKRLVTDGSVEVSPEAVGHRSAFVGAVLLTLPGAWVTGSPPTVMLQAPDLGSESAGREIAGGSPFQGSLDRSGTMPQRGEQASLRNRLLGGAIAGTCAICGVTYPARFLWAAHIKKRAVCEEHERRDLDHVAMLACLFGCDAFFEAGYIAVDNDGTVLVRDDATVDASLAEHLSRMQGRRVEPFKAGSVAYFDWHRTNMFRA